MGISQGFRFSQVRRYHAPQGSRGTINDVNVDFANKLFDNDVDDVDLLMLKRRLRLMSMLMFMAMVMFILIFMSRRAHHCVSISNESISPPPSSPASLPTSTSTGAA